MSLLKGMATEEVIEEEKDTVGGSKFAVLDTNVYPMTIEAAYVTKSKGEALALNLQLSGDNAFLKTRLWMTSAKAKGCKNFYEKTDKATGAVTKHYLPGFNQANALSLLTVGVEITELDTEVKTLDLYDYMAKQEIPTDTDTITDLIGQKVYVGVMRQTVNKRALDPATGTYKATADIYDENEIDKIFRIDDMLTVQEIMKGITEPTFMPAWLAKWEGVTKDKTTKVEAAVAGAPSQVAKKTSAFGRKG